MPELALDFQSTAAWRRENAARYPDDRRNDEAAKLLDQLAVSAGLVPSDLETAWGRVFEVYESASEDWSQMLREVGFSRFPEDAQALVCDFIKSLAGAPPMTFRQWLDIHMDLDGYIARGGSLLELPMNSIDQFPAPMTKIILSELGTQRVERLGRYCIAVGDAVSALGPDARIGDWLDEQQLREIWRRTAN